MYGMIPRARTENLLNAPPEKVFTRSNIPPPPSEKYEANAEALTPATGT